VIRVTLRNYYIGVTQMGCRARIFSPLKCGGANAPAPLARSPQNAGSPACELFVTFNNCEDQIGCILASVYGKQVLVIMVTASGGNP
jgi:hypothetical protein